ncbi:MAG: ribosome small subunit-dependent GTPase A [Firmicutes bacterium]|nr:ribosome small subunit-dependent GTPase A [Bacillota bacterium]
MLVGQITSVHKTGYVAIANNVPQFCIVNNSYKSDDKPVVGDIAHIEKRDDQHIIINIEPRKSVIGRYDFFKERYQVFASNVDLIMVVTSANREFSPARIRRFLSLSGDQAVKKLVVLTKVDLSKDIDFYTKKLEKEFPGISYFTINALDSEQVMGLEKHFKKGEVALLLGSSGVGKSTIINTLCGINIRTQDVQDERFLNKGKHTTSSRNMYATKTGRKIIDVPGVRIVGVEEDVAKKSDIFDKISELAQGCKFRNCRHITENNCAVKNAIEQGELEAEELENFFQTIENTDRKKFKK